MSRVYVTSRRLAALGATLTPREREILATVARVRVASGTQLVRLHLAQVKARQARGVLASLVERRLLGRLPRRVGGLRAGSAGFVYTLDVAGLRLVTPDRARWQRPWSVGTPFLDHSLAVTELYVRLTCAQDGEAVRLVTFEAEPASWRRFPASGGGRAVLKPDARVTLRLGPYEDQWFVEVDRGTESLPTLKRKCELYARYWQTGREQAAGGVFPRVLWLVPDATRHEQVVTVLGRLPADTWQLFTVATFDEAVARMMQGAGV
jgi:hypothetical protein